MNVDPSKRPKVLVGKTVRVVPHDAAPSYFTDVHRARVGTEGVVHAVVATRDRSDPLVKVKFGDEQRIVFFRRCDLELCDAG